MIQPFHSVVARKRAGGGGSPEWYDAIAPGSTNANDALTGYPKIQLVTAGQSGDCTKVRIYIVELVFGGDAKGALYDASRNRLSTGAGVALAVGWNEIPITPVAVTGSTNYYVGFVETNNTAGQVRYLNSSGNSHADFGGTYAGGMPDPFPDAQLSYTYAAGMYIEP